RLEKLEKLAVDYKGVDKAYAIQAGREIRVIVKQDTITDAECAVLSRDLARKIEQELTYPGQIKVTVIRESRFTDVAKRNPGKGRVPRAKSLSRQARGGRVRRRPGRAGAN